MPTYSVRAPNGKTYSISGPVGASDADVRAQILKQHPDAGAATPAKPLSAVDQYVQRWQGINPQKARALVLKQQQVAMNNGTIDQFFKDPRVQALGKIAGMKPQALSSTEQAVQIGKQAARSQRGGAAADPDLALMAGTARGAFGIPEHLAALALKATGRSKYSYGDTLAAVRAQDDAKMGLSAKGNFMGQLIGGGAIGAGVGGAVGAVGSRLAASGAPLAAKLGNVLQAITTLKKGQNVANAGRLAVTGGAAGGAQAAGEGSDVASGAEYGAAGGVALGVGAKLAQVLSRPVRDIIGATSAPAFLKRFTTATREQIMDAADTYRKATGSEPTLMELLPPADQQRLSKHVIAAGGPNVISQAEEATAARARSLGTDMANVTDNAVAPQRAAIRDGLVTDIEAARGAPSTPEDHAAIDTAMQSPEGMQAFRNHEANLHMAPHNSTVAAGSLSDLTPQVPGGPNGAMIDADPEVTSMIRTATPSVLKQRPPGQGITVGEIVGDIIPNLRDIASEGGVAGRQASTAIDHLLGQLPPEAQAAATNMNNSYAARSRMAEGMTEGMKTRLQESVQAPNQKVRNAYNTPEGEAGRVLGQSNELTRDLGGAPDTALRQTVNAGAGGTTRELAQNIGQPATDTVTAAAQAQRKSAQSLASTLKSAQGAGADGNIETLAQAAAGMHPGSMPTTKAHFMRKIMDMTYMPENRARTVVDMLYSQDPKLQQTAVNALSSIKGGNSFVQYVASLTGQTMASGGNPTDQPEPVGPSDTPVGAIDANGALNIGDVSENPAAPDASAVPDSSPYSGKLQGLLAQENPDFVNLLSKQWHQESPKGQLNPDGTPVTSSAGAIGAAQVMPGTAPEAAKLAGLPWDENAYKHDEAYNKLLGAAYMAKMLSDHGGDTVRAAASYNAGPQRVAAALRSGGDNWLSHLPAETQHYVQVVN